MIQSEYNIGGCNIIMRTINNLSNTEYKWFAVYTKFRAEKFVSEILKKKGVESYVPLMEHTKRYTRKIVKVQKPLLNCYVFVRIIKEDYIKVLQTEYVFNFLKIKEDLISIPEEEIRTLRKVVGEVNAIEVSTEFIEGQEVEVVSGNLTGLKGQLITKQSKNLFLVELKTIGLQMRIQIDPAYIKPINAISTMLN